MEQADPVHPQQALPGWGNSLCLTESKNKLKWKQKFLRVLHPAHLVFLTFSEGGASQKITLAAAQSLASFSTHRRTPLTHTPTLTQQAMQCLCPWSWILTYPWQRDSRPFLKTPLSNSHYWLTHHQEWFRTFRRLGHFSSILTVWTVCRMIRAV